MSEKLAMEILKQATIETTIGACEKCPRKDKNKTCVGCLNEAKDKALLEIERLHTIIKEAREYIKENNYHCKNQVEQEQYDKELLEILDKENI